MTSLRQALMLGEGGVISLVGAGGKTSLMFRLAHELSMAGDSVLTTTTTKIFEPEPGQSSCVLVSNSVTDLLDEAKGLIDEHRHITMAWERLPGQDKLIGFAPEIIEVFRQSRFFRWIIIEADGAAGRPLKAPADHEPVVPESTTTVVGLAGLSGIGQPLTDQWVFRSDRFAEVAGVSHNTNVNETAVANVFTHKNGIFKNTSAKASRLVFLNQADMPENCAAGRRIASQLTEDKSTGIRRVIVGHLRAESPVWKIFDPLSANHR
jgi:probable selenium-dependent hydroxylase accessory protein YqeC